MTAFILTSLFGPGGTTIALPAPIHQSLQHIMVTLPKAANANRRLVHNCGAGGNESCEFSAMRPAGKLHKFGSNETSDVLDWNQLSQDSFRRVPGANQDIRQL